MADQLPHRWTGEPLKAVRPLNRPPFDEILRNGQYEVESAMLIGQHEYLAQLVTGRIWNNLSPEELTGQLSPVR